MFPIPAWFSGAQHNIYSLFVCFLFVYFFGWGSVICFLCVFRNFDRTYRIAQAMKRRRRQSRSTPYLSAGRLWAAFNLGAGRARFGVLSDVCSFALVFPLPCTCACISDAKYDEWIVILTLLLLLPLLLSWLYNCPRVLYGSFLSLSLSLSLSVSLSLFLSPSLSISFSLLNLGEFSGDNSPYPTLVS